MIRLLKYLKPYVPVILAAVILLFIQANLELALPDYMSKIVNVGIQQNGIEDTLPLAISESKANLLLSLANEEDSLAIQNSYTVKEDRYTLVDRSNMEETASGLPFKQTFLTASILLQIQNGEPVSGIPDMPEFPGQTTPPEGETSVQAGDLSASAASSIMTEMILQKTAEIPVSQMDQILIQILTEDYDQLGIDLKSVQTRYILKNGSIMLIYTLMAAVTTILVGLIAARTSAGVAKTLRGDLFTTVQSFSGAEMDSFSTASLITRTTNDVTQVQQLVFMSIRMMIYAPIIGIGGVIRAVGKAPSMAWIIGLAVLVLLSLIGIVMTIAMPKFRIIQKLIDRLNLVSRENLSGLMVVRAFNRQSFEKTRFDNANQELTKTNLFVIRVMVLMMPAIMLIFNLLSVAIIWFGARQVAASGLQVGDMMAFLQYAMQIIMSFLMLSMMFIFIPRASVSGERISEVLNTELSIKNPDQPVSFSEKGAGFVEFRDVSFRYPGGEEHALKGISFTAEPGKTTAIIGPTGSGKSTITNLIPRLYDVSSGELLIDGVDIRNASQKDLRNRIGYVPQKNVLFSGSIMSNLQYGDEDASEADLLQAAETAQAMEFIQQKEDGMNESISQGGANISGGQKQRLAIGRALVNHRPILIFDDSFSALDFRTASALNSALKTQTGESTLIVVAQRVSSIMDAEQIIVLDEGHIVGKGTHQELMRDCREYQEIALSQLSMEELS